MAVTEMVLNMLNYLLTDAYQTAAQNEHSCLLSNEETFFCTFNLQPWQAFSGHVHVHMQQQVMEQSV